MTIQEDPKRKANSFYYLPVLAMAFVLMFLMVLLVSLIQSTTATDGYLYSPQPNDKEALSDVEPVMDYMKPDKLIGEVNSDYEERVNHPQFLTETDKQDRVVEFYASWCGHCQHYKPHYIQLARDVNKVKPVPFHAVPCPIHSEICKDQGIQGYPTIKFYKAGSAEGEVIIKNGKIEDIIIGKLSGMVEGKDHDQDPILMKNSTVTGIAATATAKAKIADKEKVEKIVQEAHTWKHKTSAEDTFHDATLSFDFAVRNSIFMTNDALNAEQAKVFSRWLNLLNKSVPSTMREVKEDATALEHQFENIIASEESLLKYMSAKKEQSWSDNCSKGVAGGGYTCGLWELFHTVTIGIVQWNIMAHERMSTLDAAEILKDYIENYFTCDECRKNFITMYDACQFQRCERLSSNESYDEIMEWKQLPLWLWETHNDVNVRLMNEERAEKGLGKATFEEEQKARWPSKVFCSKCWLDGGGWNEEEVYMYLRSHYWPRDMLSDKDIIQSKKDRAKEPIQGKQENAAEKSDRIPVSAQAYKKVKEAFHDDASPAFSPTIMAVGGLAMVVGLFYYNRNRRRYMRVRIAKSM